MANIQFHCGQCNRMLAVGEDLAGKEVRCPHCKEVVLVPAEITRPKSLPKSAARSKSNASVLLVTIVIFLIPYCILATAAAIYFYSQTRANHPLEMLPDWPRDQTDPVKRKNSVSMVKVDPNAPVPPWLRTTLGKPIRIGDLEVTPEKVEKRPIVYRYEGSTAADPSAGPALVLTLKLKNLGDYAFAPDDLAYRRAWRDDDFKKYPKGDMPYTRLEIGKDRFYGGPCDWEMRKPKGAGWREPDPIHFVEGQYIRKFLEPGEEAVTLVCTNPEDERVMTALGKSNDPLFWRVQMRRGLVSDGTREVTASGVVGVEFRSEDISR